jgi:acetyl esterase/lipase
MTALTKRQTLAGLSLASLAAACSPLGALNALAPKEKNSKLLKANVAYGADRRQAYDVYAPVNIAADTDSGLAPMLVFFYGGGWNSGSKDLYTWAGRALASLGYVVVVPDYRLVPQVRFPVFLEDSEAAVRHAMANADAYGADAQRLGLMGHSAGAYNAIMLTLAPNYLNLPANGPNPVKAVVGVAGPYDFYPFDVESSINAFGQWPKPEETQPVNYAHKTGTKFQLIYSTADKLVAPKSARNLAAKLEAAGDDVELVRYDKPSHPDMVAALSLPLRGRAKTFGDVKDFLGRAL